MSQCAPRKLSLQTTYLMFSKASVIQTWSSVGSGGAWSRGSDQPVKWFMVSCGGGGLGQGVQGEPWTSPAEWNRDGAVVSNAW